jgi:hypothetical protein
MAEHVGSTIAGHSYAARGLDAQCAEHTHDGIKYVLALSGLGHLDTAKEARASGCSFAGVRSFAALFFCLPPPMAAH